MSLLTVQVVGETYFCINHVPQFEICQIWRISFPSITPSRYSNATPSTMAKGRGTSWATVRSAETLILLAFCVLQTDAYVLQACKWHHKHLTYHVGWIPEKYDRTFVEDDIAKAFATWSNHSDLTFTPRTGKKVDIPIRFGKIDGVGKTVASAYLTCSGVGNILFDEEELHWGMNGEGNSAFFNTAVHEVGHVIGVYHSKVKPSVMNGGSITCELGLFEDDIAAVQALYGPKSKVKSP